MNDIRYRASNFYIEQQSEAFPQLLPDPHREVGEISDSRSGPKAKSRRSTPYSYLCLILPWVIFAVAIGIFIDIHHPSVVRSLVKVLSFHPYVLYAGAIRDLYPSSESSNCTQQVLSPSTIISALTIPSREAPSLWDRLSTGHEDGGGHDMKWIFQGTRGQVGIRLSSDSLFLSTISLRVPTLEDGQSPNCAPRDGILWGILNQDANFSSRVFGVEGEGLDDLIGTLPVGVALPVHDERDTILPLASFRYNRYKTGTEQVFQVRQPAKMLGLRFGVVVVQILGNWGGETTCVDRMTLQGCQ